MVEQKKWVVTEDTAKSITHERSAPAGYAPTSRNNSTTSTPTVSAPQTTNEARTPSSDGRGNTPISIPK